MGLIRKFHSKHETSKPHRPSWTKSILNRFTRLCHFEQMESRQLLSASAPIQLGATYFEEANPYDSGTGNVFEISFVGGAPGTQLKELKIDTDKYGDGLKIGDVFFDTAAGGLGAYGSSPFKIVSKTGIDSVTAEVADGGTQLVLRFTGFDAGERLIFTIDVDEQGFLGANAVAEGNEFEGSTMTATFTAPHYAEAVGSDIFVDFYDSKLAGSGLPLPPDAYNTADAYLPPGAVAGPVYTAGAIFPLQQIPLPITISGNVYFDPNGNNYHDAGELGLAGVSLSLYELVDGSYVNTGKTAVTDSAGHYKFDGLLPGTYRIVETQPAGYWSVGSTVGTVSGQPRGAIGSVDILTGINLNGGEDSINNDFAEWLPCSISGRVFADLNGNAAYDAGDALLAGVTIRLQDSSGNVLQTTATDAYGDYAFTSLTPGVYSVVEVQPDGYLEGDSLLGSIGGTRVSENLMKNIGIPAGVDAIRYDFYEVLPASLSGFVYADDSDDGVFDNSESGIGGVTVALLDAGGNPTGLTAVTDENGYYSFTNLRPGTYGVREIQPSAYIDGLDTPGTAGGTAHNPGDLIDGIALAGGTKAKNYNFGEIRAASLSGRVFVDLNGNDAYDSGETLLSGITMHLTDAQGNRIASTSTDVNGYYQFIKLKPGTYAVEEVQPAGYLQGGNRVGSAGGALSGSDHTININLGPDVHGVNYDFWELLPAKISGYVFQDGPVIKIKKGDSPPDIPSVRDGLLTPDDTRLAGVTLRLCDGIGIPLTDAYGNPIIAVTNAEGYYEFNNLAPGLYSVVEVQPDGYMQGLDTAGNLGGVVVNQYTEISNDMLGILAVDPYGSSIVQIEVLPGSLGTQYNFSEVKIQEEDNPGPLNPDNPVSPEIPRYFPAGDPALYHPPYAPLQIGLPSPFGGGGSGPGGTTWHLSVINGGQPREIDGGTEYNAFPGADIFDPASWKGQDPNRGGEWLIADQNGDVLVKHRFGLDGGTPVVGDWNGDGISDIGMFLDGHWFLDLNGNGVWDEGDLWAKLGDGGDQPVAGDWDGDGKADIGIFGIAWLGDQKAVESDPGLPDAMNPPKNRYKNLPPDPTQAAVGIRAMKRTHAGKIRADLIDHVFEFGTAGDRAVVGDWTGTGIKKIGIFRDGTWYLDIDGDGRWSAADVMVQFGREGDVPVAGDWTGDGITKLGVYRGGTFHLDTDNNRRLDATDKVFELGAPGDKPFAGDFDGDGVDTVGVYREASVQPNDAAANYAASGRK